MSEATNLLDRNLRNLNRPVLDHGGRISHEVAKARAEGEYEKYRERLRAIRHEEADRAIANLRSEERALPKRRP